MATYKQIQKFVKDKNGFMPQSCWIAHAKEITGLPVKRSHRRTGSRVKPCPEDKLKPIQDAFRHFGMMEEEVTMEVERSN